MRNNIIFGAILIAVCFAIWGIFSLIFSELGTLMVLNAVSGMLMTVVLLMNILMVSSLSSLTIRNAATLRILNIAVIILFVWTLMFTFVFGNYDDTGRSLTGLYVGYLLIFAVSAVFILVADRGGSISQAKSDEIQTAIEYKSTLLSKLDMAKNRLSVIEPNTRADVHKILSLCISKFKSIPLNKLNGDSVAYSGLENSIDMISESIEAGDIENLFNKVKELELILSSLK